MSPERGLLSPQSEGGSEPLEWWGTGSEGNHSLQCRENLAAQILCFCHALANVFSWWGLTLTYT